MDTHSLNDKLDALAYTDMMCANDPLLAQTRRQLLKIERAGEKAGWDGPEALARIFQLDAHTEAPRVAHTWCDGYTTSLRLLTEVFQGDVGRAFMELADRLVEMADYCATGVLPEAMRGKAAEIEAARVLCGVDFTAPGQDIGGVMTPMPGFRMHGWGVRTEAWSAPVSRKDTEGIISAAEEGRLYRHEKRREMRVVSYVGRDGLLWWVGRVRGQNPEVVLTKPESSPMIGGAVSNALGRIVNALVSNHVPVRPAVVRSCPTGPAKPDVPGT